jgi:hypothetical protein
VSARRLGSPCAGCPDPPPRFFRVRCGARVFGTSVRARLILTPP